MRILGILMLIAAIALCKNIGDQKRELKQQEPDIEVH